MDIDATVFGQFVFVLAIIMGITGYYLGKRKTQTPKLVATLCFFSALLPPLSAIFLMLLALKKDLPHHGS